MAEKQAEGQLQSHLHESSGTTCLKYPETCYSFRGAAEGGKLKGKNNFTTLHQVKAEVVAKYLLESNMSNP